MDVKTGRAVDIRTLGGGWPKLYKAFNKKSENAKLLKEKWDIEHPKHRNLARSPNPKL